MPLQHHEFTSESVSEGHPDKVSDQISDAVVDLFLAKDPTAKVAVEQQGKIIADALAAKKSPQDIITDLYIRCLSRKPTAEEMKQFEGHLSAEGANQTQILEDIFWALLNSREFLFNH